MIEFTMLSRATKNPKYERAARRATVGLWSRRSKLGLVGNHINIETGVWTHQDSGLGTNVDSFYEYLVKTHLLFNDGDLLSMFFESYAGIMKYIRRGVWYLDVNMHSGAVSWMVYSSLASFWPGVQVLVGDIEAAVETQYSIHSLWRRFGGIPEVPTPALESSKKTPPPSPALKAHRAGTGPAVGAHDAVFRISVPGLAWLPAPVCLFSRPCAFSCRLL
jgi:mannosidase alpha-like ER degradation enhancer 2